MSAVLPLAVTLGDPAGIGPEVAAKVCTARAQADRPLLLIGGLWSLQLGADAAGVGLDGVELVRAPGELEAGVGLIDLGAEPEQFEYGSVNSECGGLAVRSVELAARLCLSGDVSGVVTCPINKAAIHAAGYVDDMGHQEILARLTGARNTATMLMAGSLRVVHLSTHKSLVEAARFVTRASVLSKLGLTHDTLERWGLPKPHIAVAALNPHGGESGLLGREELDEIGPAVEIARSRGIRATGPLPADSVFNRAIGGEFDVVLAMYHDQGHIAIKVYDFHGSTTATLGIPFVRTSVDHGTAFDIAGRGVADERGLAAAIVAAEALASSRLAAL